MKKIAATLLGLGLCAGAFTACSKNTISTQFRHSDFSLADFRLSHSVLVASNEVHVLAFKKSYAGLFTAPDSLSTRLAHSILDSMHRKPAISIRPAPAHIAGVIGSSVDSLSPEARTHADSLLAALGARYLVHIRDITLTNSGKTPTADTLAVKGTERCIVYLTTEIRTLPGLQLAHSFKVRVSTETDMVSARAAVLKSVEGAALETATYLRGY